MGINKTIGRIQSNLYWSNMYKDITRLCESYGILLALFKIDTVLVTEALIKTFSDTGIPKEILSEKTQFSSNVMKEIHRILSIKSLCIAIPRTALLPIRKV